MTLTAQNGEAGLWRNPAWVPGTPGVFALVIGVSRYLYLKKDENSLQMESLHVSALTAYRLFEWLGSLYRLEGIPVASCRLLLAPTAAEIAVEPGLTEHARLPLYEECRRAIEEWFDEMNQLSPRAAQASRSLFFFSGHGLEVTDEMQVLLPQDYLSPPGRSYNRAIGTNNLRRGLKALKVNRHFLFMDACRNDHDNLKQVEPIEGDKILNQVLGASRNSQCLVPLFFSSAAGKESFQPLDPRQGESLFGTALLEGLKGTGLRLDCDNRRCLVNLDPLLTYCKQRIPALALERFHEFVDQEVRIAGDYVQDPLTELPPPPPISFGLKRGVATVEDSTRSLIERDVPTNWRPGDNSQSHDIFQHETVTMPFANVRVYSYATREWLAPEKDYIVHRVRLAEDGRRYQVEFSLGPDRLPDTTYWLELQDSSRMFAVVLPSTRRELRFQFSVDVEYPGVSGQPHLTRVSVAISDDSDRPYGMLARAWDAYRRASLSSATEIILSPESALDLERALERKMESPVGATIAGLLLVKHQLWHRLHDWLANLAAWFPWFGDGPALRAEQLLRQRPDDPESKREALQQLLTLSDRDLPMLSEVLGMVYSRLVEFDDEMDSIENDSEREVLQRLITRYRNAVSNARPGGLFTVWAGAIGAIRPQIVSHEEKEEAIFEFAEVGTDESVGPAAEDANESENERYLEME